MYCRAVARVVAPVSVVGACERARQGSTSTTYQVVTGDLRALVLADIGDVVSVVAFPFDRIVAVLLGGRRRGGGRRGLGRVCVKSEWEE